MKIFSYATFPLANANAPSCTRAVCCGQLISFPLPAIVTCLLSVSVFASNLELDEYLQRANAAKSRGDWESVASQIAQAINHPDLPKTGTIRSAVHLEYGRAMGVLCQYEESEKYLLQAKEIAEKARSPLFSTLYELGALSIAQKKFAGAADYFSQLLPMMGQELRNKSSTLVVADAYEKYAIALTATGMSERAESLRREAGKIRQTGATLPRGTLTPYGAQCQKS